MARPLTRRTCACLLLAVVAWVVCARPPQARAQAAVKPNLLFVLSDDQRADTMQVMPATVGNFPIRFKNMFVTTSLCCPSRSSFLTGRYVHNTGVTTNVGYPKFQPQEPDSLGPWLRAQGYYTGFVGKYFNHFSIDDPAPPGWDEFYGKVWEDDGTPIGDSSSFALREKYREDGVLHDGVTFYSPNTTPESYITTVIGDLAVRFLERARDPRFNPQDKPWALLVWPNAPNIGAPEDQYKLAPLPRWRRPPSFLEKDMSDKPREIRRSPYRKDSAAFHARVRRNQLRQLLSLDDLVDRLFKRLRANGERSQTWGIFASDNGRLWGEHHLSRKVYAYEESIRVPLRMWIPGMGKRVVTDLVANIDVAPTLTALAGDSSRHHFDGRSLLPLLNQPDPAWRSVLLLENWIKARFDGLRTKQWKYVLYRASGHQELYDLHADPYELVNVWRHHPRVTERLRRRVDALSQK
jgi:N-acetylglucosamine-6-sulfatase